MVIATKNHQALAFTVGMSREGMREQQARGDTGARGGKRIQREV